MPRKYGPKQHPDPVVGQLCPACLSPFAVGDFTALIPLGPGLDPRARQAAREGRAYNAVGIEVRWSCATGRPDDEDWT